MMQQDEKQFFIAMLEAKKFKSFNDTTTYHINAIDIGKNIGINKDRVREILNGWWLHEGIWNYSYPIESGWFILEKLKGEYKRIYKKCIKNRIEYIEPILEKSTEHGFDNTPIFWEDFLKIREAAKIVAEKIGYPVYLVGSSLSKPIPRDIDISVIIPVDEYEKMFGKLPTKQEGFAQYLSGVFLKSYNMTSELHHCLFDTHHIDVKVCPDVWWKDKDKMLLAEPKWEEFKL